MRIQDCALREIFDSRGDPTVEIGLETEGRWFFAQIPSGKSRGKREAVVLNAAEARRAVREIREIVKGGEFETIRALDETALSLDGTPDKSKLGGNVILGVSIAGARALAYERREKVWETVEKEFFGGEKASDPPLVFSNFINGGAHAKNNLRFQEYLVIARPKKSVADAINWLIAVYRELGAYLAKKCRLPVIPIGDEGGYAVPFKNNFEPIAVLEEIAGRFGFGNFYLGIDAAATNFFNGEKYKINGKNLSRKKFAELYKGIFARHKNFISIEDPFAEDDREGFALMRDQVQSGDKLIIGDDLTTTNSAAIRECGEEKLINAVIVKPNQIGTITETCAAIKEAWKFGMKVIISHRSGETEDNFIVHLARACSADGIKIGAPARERIAKFNELIRIYG